MGRWVSGRANGLVGGLVGRRVGGRVGRRVGRRNGLASVQAGGRMGWWACERVGERAVGGQTGGMASV